MLPVWSHAHMARGALTLFKDVFHWEPEGHYCQSVCTAIAPFWFSMEHCWIVIMPFWLSTDDTTHNSDVKL